MAHYYPGLITNVGNQISQFMPGYQFSWSPSPYFHNPLHSIASQDNSLHGSHLDCDKYILKKPKKLPFHMKKNCNDFQFFYKNPNKSSASTHTSSESCYFYDNRNKNTSKDLMTDWSSNIPQGLPCFRHPTVKHKDKVEHNCNETKNIQLKKNYRGKKKCSCGLPPQVLLQPYPVIFPVCCPCCQLCMHNRNKEQKSEFQAIPPTFLPCGPENSESFAFTKDRHKISSKNSSRSKCSIQSATPRHCIDVHGNMHEYLSENLETEASYHNSLFFKHDSSNCYKPLKRRTSVSECVNQSSETSKYPKSKSGAKKKNYMRKTGSSHTSVRSTMSLEFPPHHSRLDSLKDFGNELSDHFQRENMPKETFEKKEQKLLTENMSHNFGRINISSEALDKFAMELLSDKIEINNTYEDNISRISASKNISSSKNVTNFTNEYSMFPSSKNCDDNKNILYGNNNNTSHEGNFNLSTSSKGNCKNLDFDVCFLNTSHEANNLKDKGNPIFSARSSKIAESLLDDTHFNCLKSDVYSSSSSTSMTDFKTNSTDSKTVHIRAVQSIIRQIEQENFKEIYESIINPLFTTQPSEMYENTTGLVLNLEPNLHKDSEVKINDDDEKFQF